MEYLNHLILQKLQIGSTTFCLRSSSFPLLTRSCCWKYCILTTNTSTNNQVQTRQTLMITRLNAGIRMDCLSSEFWILFLWMFWNAVMAFLHRFSVSFFLIHEDIWKDILLKWSLLAHGAFLVICKTSCNVFLFLLDYLSKGNREQDNLF